MTPKSKIHPEWTEARVKGFIVSALRNASRRWKPKYVCLATACVGRKENRKTGKMAKHYKCAKCSNLYVARDVQVDHINPVINPDKGFEDWNTYIDRLFVALEGYQVLCTECHDRKTKKEKQYAKLQANKRLSRDK